jgi:hypothetical protein
MDVTKKPAGLAAVCLLLMTAASWAGQNTAQPRLTSDDIALKMGTEADARDVLVIALTYTLAHSGNESRPEYFLASQLRTEWLPVVPGVQFIRLADTELPAHLAACGTYWWINNLERAGNVVSLMVSQKCGGRSLGLIVSFGYGEGWHLGPEDAGKDHGWAPGIGCGIYDPLHECACLRR